MKKSSLITLAVSLAALAAVVPANAQPHGKVNVTLPYAAIVGNVSLPAGDCTITSLDSNGRSTFFLLHSDAGPAFYVKMDRDLKLDNRNGRGTEVRLRRTADSYELQGLMIDGISYRVGQSLSGR